MEGSASQAAAGLIDELLSEGLIGEEADEATAEAVEQQAETENIIEIPEITFGVPEELSELFEGPDDDLDTSYDEDEDSPASQQVPEYDEFDDPEKAKLAKQLAKLNKQLAWEKQQKVKASRKVWAEEARKYFQFSNPEVIQADSRRAFLRQAKGQHDAVAKVAKPIFDELKRKRDELVEAAVQEGRAEAAKRWGRAPHGPGAATAGQGNTQSMGRERLAQGKSITDVIVNKFRNGEVNI